MEATSRKPGPPVTTKEPPHTESEVNNCQPGKYCHWSSHRPSDPANLLVAALSELQMKPIVCCLFFHSGKWQSRAPSPASPCGWLALADSRWEIFTHNGCHLIVFNFWWMASPPLSSPASYLRAHLIPYVPSHLSFQPSPHLQIDPSLAPDLSTSASTWPFILTIISLLLAISLAILCRTEYF